MRLLHFVSKAVDPWKMADAIRQLVVFSSEFRKLLDAKADHILEMIAGIQQQLQAQERTPRRRKLDMTGVLQKFSTNNKLYIIPSSIYCDEFEFGENNHIENQQGYL